MDDVEIFTGMFLLFLFLLFWLRSRLAALPLLLMVGMLAPTIAALPAIGYDETAGAFYVVGLLLLAAGLGIQRWNELTWRGSR